MSRSSNSISVAADFGENDRELHDELVDLPVFSNGTFDDYLKTLTPRQWVIAQCCADATGKFYRRLPKEERNDPVLLTAALGLCPLALQWASIELRKSRKLVNVAAWNAKDSADGSFFRYAARELRNDRAFVLEIVGVCGMAFRHITKALRNDKEIAMAAFRSISFDKKKETLSVSLFRSMGAMLRNDADLVLAYVQLNGHAITRIDPKWRSNSKVMLAAIEINPKMIELAAPELWEDREFVLGAIVKDFEAIYKVPLVFRNDRAFMLKAIALNPDIYREVEDSLHKDSEVIAAAVTKDRRMVEYIPFDRHCEYRIAMVVVGIDGSQLRNLPETARRDIRIVRAACEQCPHAIRWSLCKEPEIRRTKTQYFLAMKNEQQLA